MGIDAAAITIARHHTSDRGHCEHADRVRFRVSGYLRDYLLGWSPEGRPVLVEGGVSTDLRGWLTPEWTIGLPVVDVRLGDIIEVERVGWFQVLPPMKCGYRPGHPTVGVVKTAVAA